MIDALFDRFPGLNDDPVDNSSMNNLTKFIDQSNSNRSNQMDFEDQTIEKEWLNSVMVIVCCRLGMTKVEPEYLEVIRSFFACKVNVGILGGRPGEAYYLIGLQDGFLIFLDPHNTQEAIPSEEDEIKRRHTTYHESNAKKIHFSKLDPSLGFAFLLRKKSDFLRFKDFMLMGKRQHGKNWIFSSMETKPDYMKSKPQKRQEK